MKAFLTFAVLLGLVSLAACFDEDMTTCTDKLNADPHFKDKCIELYCRCLDDCSGGRGKKTVDAQGNVVSKNNEDYTVEDCFRNNKCSIKNELKKMIDCTTCIMERPEDTYKCDQVREREEKKKNKKKKKKADSTTDKTASA